MKSNDSNKKRGPDFQGCLFIVSAPSGAGKTTLCRALLDRFPDMVYSVSYTTRKPRQGEQDGIDYFFISKTEFRKRIDCNLWAEWAQVHGHYYGTSSELLDQSLNAGVDMLLDIDVEGTIQILNRYPESVTIFILPPSLDILRRRLESRGTEDRSAVQRRLNNAEREMAHKDMYRHIIINDRLPEATTKLISLVQTYRAGGRP